MLVSFAPLSLAPPLIVNAIRPLRANRWPINVIRIAASPLKMSSECPFISYGCGAACLLLTMNYGVSLHPFNVRRPRISANELRPSKWNIVRISPAIGHNNLETFYPISIHRLLLTPRPFTDSLLLRFCGRRVAFAAPTSDAVAVAPRRQRTSIPVRAHMHKIVAIKATDI